jgi:hypothetical protein
MDEIQEHEQKLMAAFGKVLAAEDRVAEAKSKLDEAVAMLGLERSTAETALTAAWGEVALLLNETGEVEVLLPGSVTDFRVGWTRPRESVRADPEATPDEYCRVERKPKLKEIGEYLKGLRDGGLALPNWASFQPGEPKLAWKAVKKSTKTEKE